MKGTALWAVGAVASAAIHVALVAVLRISVAPELIEEPEPEVALLDMSPVEVRRSDARAAEAEAEAPGEASAAGEATGARPIRSGRAPSATAAGERVAAAEFDAARAEVTAAAGEPALAAPRDAEVVAPVSSAAERIASAVSSPVRATAATPAARKIGASVATATPVLDVEAEIRRLSAALPAVAAVAPAGLHAKTVAHVDAPVVSAEPANAAGERPVAPPLDLEAVARADIEAPDAAEAIPEGAVPASIVVASLGVRPSAPPANALAARSRAATAWSGEGALSPRSAATIQSFMRPRNRRESGAEDEPVDVIGRAIAATPCSRLQAAFRPDTGALELLGHVPDEAAGTALVDRLGAVIGDSIPVTGSLLLLPEPQCHVLAAVEELGLPQSEELRDDPLVVGEAAQSAIWSYADGDRFELDIEAPEFPAWIYLDYFDRDGAVLHVLPNEYAPPRRWRPAEVGTLSALGPKGHELRIGPPFGRDIAVLFALSEPIDPAGRPLVEDAGPYLEWLGEEIARLKADHPALLAEWYYLFIDTFPTGERPATID